MAKSNLFFVSGLIACFLSLALVASSHVVGKRLGDPSAASKIEDIALHERSEFYDDEANLKHTLLKRGALYLDAIAPDDAGILQQAFADMVEVVTYVQQNPNPQVLARYFRPTDQAHVTAIFNTVRQMAQPGGFPNPPKQLFPTDLNQIRVSRKIGVGFTLAESFNVQAISTGPRVEVCDFGWGALYRRLKSDVDCDCDIKKTSYKMHILGTLLLHEVLHFNSVTNLAWVQAPNPFLQDGQCLDDQPGNFPLTNKAYGPYEAMQLLQQDPANAMLNIENYVWYALETYWLHQCPNAPTQNGMFQAAGGNDIPAACKQAAKGFWCWIS